MGSEAGVQHARTGPDSFLARTKGRIHRFCTLSFLIGVKMPAVLPAGDLLPFPPSERGCISNTLLVYNLDSRLVSYHNRMFSVMRCGENLNSEGEQSTGGQQPN